MAMYKNKIWIALFCSIGLFSIACNKQGTNVVLPDNSGTAPVLSSSAGDSIALNDNTKNDPALALSWTNPNYVFSNGINSLNVNYNIEFDTVGANFTSPKLQTVQVTSALDTTFTVDQLNSIVANGLGLSVGNTHVIQVRVTSFLAPYTSGSPNIAQLSSNAFSYKVVPYFPPPIITPPASGTLFIVGSATPGGWDNPMSVNPATQQFTQVSKTEYTITIQLTGSGEYKFIAVNGSWSDQWSVKDPDTYPNGGPFISNGQNCIAPSASGMYVIDVNFQTGIFTVTKKN